MSEIDEQLIFEMGYNKGFKDGIKGSILRERIDEMLAEIESAKNPLPYEDDYDKGVNVGLRIATQAIYKYCDKESKDGSNNH